MRRFLRVDWCLPTLAIAVGLVSFQVAMACVSNVCYDFRFNKYYVTVGGTETLFCDQWEYSNARKDINYFAAVESPDLAPFDLTRPNRKKVGYPPSGVGCDARRAGVVACYSCSEPGPFGPPIGVEAICTPFGNPPLVPPPSDPPPPPPGPMPPPMP